VRGALRSFTSQAGAEESSAFSKMPTLMQEQVLKCLTLLEIQPEKTDQTINI